MTATLPSAHLFAIRRRRRGDKVVLTPNLQVIFHVIWRVLGKIISFEGFENPYSNVVYDGIHFNEVISLQSTDFNSIINRLHRRLFSGYVPNTSCVKMNILRKKLKCVNLLIKVLRCKAEPKIFPKRSSRWVFLRKCLKFRSKYKNAFFH